MSGMVTREELMAMPVTRLRIVARENGVCLGYAAHSKASTVDELLSWQRHNGAPLEVGGEVCR